MAGNFQVLDVDLDYNIEFDEIQDCSYIEIKDRGVVVCQLTGEIGEAFIERMNFLYDLHQSARKDQGPFPQMNGGARGLMQDAVIACSVATARNCAVEDVLTFPFRHRLGRIVVISDGD